MPTTSPVAADYRYMLRRTLVPWKMQETLDETVRYTQEFGIDEVIWKIDTEEFSHGLPTLERISGYLPHLVQSRQMLEKIGAHMSINPWVTQGMRDAGLDMRPVHPDFEFMVDITGVQARAIACPLSPGWRKWISQAFVLYASTGPRVLWIEDDIRVHGHRPVSWACFCERHIRQFNQQHGCSFTREQLIEQILKPGEPTQVRKQWMQFTGRGILDAVAQIAQAVYGRYPQVQLGLMCSAPWQHAIEWRDWDALLKTVAGPHPVVTIRPCMGNYQEVSPRGLYDSRQLVSATLAVTAEHKSHACTEVENWPFSRFAKSVSFTRAQVLLSLAMRCPSITFNMHDHVGTPLYDEPQYARMLREERPRCDALAKVYGPQGVERGIRALCPKDGGFHRRLKPNAKFGDLSMSKSFWADSLQALGCAMTWQLDSLNRITAAAGQHLLALSNELESIFRGGVLLDLAAVECMLELGLGNWIGVRGVSSFARLNAAIPAEHPTDPAFAGDRERYMTVDHLGLSVRVGKFDLLPGTKAISELVDPDRRPVQHGWVLYENSLGGRVAMCPYEMSFHSPPHWFLNWHRQEQAASVLRWLGRGELPLLARGGPYGLPIRTDYPGYTLASVMNTALDPWPQVQLEMQGIQQRQGKVELLSPQGEWTILPTNQITWSEHGLQVCVNQSLTPLDMLTVRIS